jgi:hypothetical protein
MISDVFIRKELWMSVLRVLLGIIVLLLLLPRSVSGVSASPAGPEAVQGVTG